VIHLTFERETRAGLRIRGDVRLPDGPPPRSAVVVVHGFKGFKDWGFFPYVSERLAGAGHAAVSFNFSGSGVDGGDGITDLGAFAANTFTRELEELALVMDLTRGGDLLPRKPRTVGLFAHSRGGGDAILHAAGDPCVSALVTWGAVSTFRRWSQATRLEWRERGRVFVLDGQTGRHLPLDVSLLDDFERHEGRLDILRHAASVTARWLVVHGAEDLTVPVDEARALARAAPGARLLLIEEAGHTLGASHPLERRTPPPELEQAVGATLRHLERHLAPGG
jgi:pimeloyl-ACP methyl ester carboxylesterase